MLAVLVVLGGCTDVRDEQPASLCERYAEAAERVIGDWYAELNSFLERDRYSGSPHVPALGGPNASEFYAMRGALPLILAPEVESSCSWRKLNLMLKPDEVAEYWDPEIALGSILDDLRRQEGLERTRTGCGSWSRISTLGSMPQSIRAAERVGAVACRRR